MAEDRAHDPARKPNLGLPNFVQEKLDKNEANKSKMRHQMTQNREIALNNAREDRAFDLARRVSERRNAGDHTYGDYSYPDEPERPQS